MTYKVIEYNSSKGLEFEFVGIEGWDEFEKLVEILEKKYFVKFSKNMMVRIRDSVYLKKGN